MQPGRVQDFKGGGVEVEGGDSDFYHYFISILALSDGDHVQSYINEFDARRKQKMSQKGPLLKSYFSRLLFWPGRDEFTPRRCPQVATQ